MATSPHGSTPASNKDCYLRTLEETVVELRGGSRSRKMKKIVRSEFGGVSKFGRATG